MITSFIYLIGVFSTYCVSIQVTKKTPNERINVERKRLTLSMKSLKRKEHLFLTPRCAIVLFFVQRDHVVHNSRVIIRKKQDSATRSHGQLMYLSI